MASMTLPVVIVSYNTANLLRQCVAALIRSEGVTTEIWVVDNGSRDCSVDMLRSEHPSVHVLPHARNLGFAAANNVALRQLGFAARSTPTRDAPGGSDASPASIPRRLPELVLLLNPDTKAHPTAIATLLEFMHSHPRAGMAGGQLVFPDGHFQQSAFHFPGIGQTFFDFFPLNHRLAESRLNGRYARRAAPFEIDHPLGACMMLRGEAIQQVGLLDEGYFMYVEEVDWCRRLRRSNWQVWCEPRALVVHHEAQSTRQLREAMYVQLWRSRDRYFRAYHGPLYVSLIHAIMRLGLERELRRLKREPAITADERARWALAIATVQAMCD
jgi:N-acetylglucosaminyl-diphospho-decaprenol L-rhamnosyltransferase